MYATALKTELDSMLSRLVDSSIYRIYQDSIITCLPETLFVKILETFKQDYWRYYPNQPIETDKIFINLPLTGIFLHRISRAFFLDYQEKQARFYSNLIRLVSQMEIFYSADIGPGLKINHGLGLVIGAHCRIGENALLYQNTVIGDKKPLARTREARPDIGSHLVMFSNAKILGPVKIGDHAVIEQNAVCTRDLGPHHLFRNSGQIEIRNRYHKESR